MAIAATDDNDDHHKPQRKLRSATADRLRRERESGWTPPPPELVEARVREHQRLAYAAANQAARAGGPMFRSQHDELLSQALDALWYAAGHWIEATGVPVGTYIGISIWRRMKHVSRDLARHASRYRMIEFNAHNEPAIVVVDDVEHAEAAAERQQAVDALQSALRQLKPAERAVIQMRFLDADADRSTLKDVGRRMPGQARSKQRAGQIEKAALAKLRRIVQTS